MKARLFGGPANGQYVEVAGTHTIAHINSWKRNQYTYYLYRWYITPTGIVGIFRGKRDDVS